VKLARTDRAIPHFVDFLGRRSRCQIYDFTIVSDGGTEANGPFVLKLSNLIVYDVPEDGP